MSMPKFFVVKDRKGFNKPCINGCFQRKQIALATGKVKFGVQLTHRKGDLLSCFVFIQN
jgi:hypothetical protein